MATAFEFTFPSIRPEGFQKDSRAALRSWGKDFVALLITENLSGRHGDMGLNRRSGNLARGWNSALEEVSGGADLKAWVSGPAADGKDGAAGYARMQEEGGTITPTKSKWLWIPLQANLTAAGVMRMTPTEAIQKGGFIAWNKGPIFFGVSGSGKKREAGFQLTPLFVLKKSVTIKPRMGAASLFRDRLSMLERAILFAAESAFGGT